MLEDKQKVGDEKYITARKCQENSENLTRHIIKFGLKYINCDLIFIWGQEITVLCENTLGIKGLVSTTLSWYKEIYFVLSYKYADHKTLRKI